MAEICQCCWQNLGGGFESLPLRHTVLSAEKLLPEVTEIPRNCGNFASSDLQTDLEKSRPSFGCRVQGPLFSSQGNSGPVLKGVLSERSSMQIRRFGEACLTS